MLPASKLIALRDPDTSSLSRMRSSCSNNTGDQTEATDRSLGLTNPRGGIRARIRGMRSLGVLSFRYAARAQGIYPGLRKSD